MTNKISQKQIKEVRKISPIEQKNFLNKRKNLTHNSEVLDLRFFRSHRISIHKIPTTDID